MSGSGVDFFPRVKKGGWGQKAGDVQYFSEHISEGKTRWSDFSLECGNFGGEGYIR